MKYPCNVVYNGKWYRAGEEVPVVKTGSSEPKVAAEAPKRKPGRPKKSES